MTIPDGVCRTDVSYHDMEEINKMQSLADLERFLSLISTHKKKNLFTDTQH